MFVPYRKSSDIFHVTRSDKIQNKTLKKRSVFASELNQINATISSGEIQSSAAVLFSADVAVHPGWLLLCCCHNDDCEDDGQFFLFRLWVWCVIFIKLLQKQCEWKVISNQIILNDTTCARKQTWELPVPASNLFSLFFVRSSAADCEWPSCFHGPWM